MNSKSVFIGHCGLALVIVMCCCFAGLASAQQPTVAPGPNEPDWEDLLEAQWGLMMMRDLRNPYQPAHESAGVFRRVNPDKPVTFEPILAFGLETTTRGGWYSPASDTAQQGPKKVELWSYTFKQPEKSADADKFADVPGLQKTTTFHPTQETFGLWVSNDEFQNETVYSQPSCTRRQNKRLQAQPYKAMIYPNRDRKTGKLIPHSYVIGWEYSTNDDFQDVVTVISNVELLPASADLGGVLVKDARVQKLAGGFTFTEGPAWDARREVLYFSDIPPANIVSWDGSEARIINSESGQSNGLMMDRAGMLIACEHGGRRVSRAVPGNDGRAIVTHFQGKKLNSPNDLWIDQTGGFYFTDPRYGNRDSMEMSIEGVYYVNADGEITRVIDDLAKPNGIAIAPDGRYLYVCDNGADALYRYPITAPGKLGKGERFVYVWYPDGMTVDDDGRLYVTCAKDIWVFDRNGGWVGEIKVAEGPANCTFGGRDQKTLFITARKSLYAVQTQVRGWHVHLDGVRRYPPTTQRARPEMPDEQ
jgi:gluconolactonase